MVVKRQIALFAGIGVAVATAFAFFRRRGDSTGKTLGRAVGGAVVDLAGGLVEGIEETLTGVVEEALGVSPFTANPTGGRTLQDRQTNVQGLQGRLKEPEPSSGDYIVEVQNTSGSNLRAVRVDLVVDKFGISPRRENVGTFDIPAGTGILARGTILTRSVTGILPVTATLYGNAYVLDKNESLAGRT